MTQQLPSADPWAERTLLATVLDNPQEAPWVAQQELGSVWESAWTEPDTVAVAAAVSAIMGRREQPGWVAVREYLQQVGDAMVLDGLQRFVEDPAFVLERCAQVRALAQQRRLDAVSRLIEASRGRKSPTELVDEVSTLVHGAASQGLKIKTMAELGNENWATFCMRRKNGAALIGIPTGFREIDAATLGLQEGKPYILGARPGHGKTSIACSIAVSAARAGKAVFVVAHEMDAKDYHLRIAASIAKINYGLIRTGNLRVESVDRLRSAFDEANRLPIRTCDDTLASPQQLQSAAHALAAQCGPGLVIVDYIQLERMRNFHGGTRTDELAQISQGWLHTFKRTRHAGLLLSQLNREPSKRGPCAPRLSDLRDSGALEQDAHAAMLLWRPGLEDDNAAANLAHLALAKNRDGPLCRTFLHFDGSAMHFRDWRMDDREQTKEEMTRVEASQAALL